MVDEIIILLGRIVPGVGGRGRVLSGQQGPRTSPPPPCPCSLAQRCRQRKNQSPSSPRDSLSPNDVHSEAQGILHGVGLALWGRSGAQYNHGPPQDPLGLARLSPVITLASLMASLSLSRALWKYATCRCQQSLVQLSAWTLLLLPP